MRHSACACGFSAPDGDGLAAHLGDVFIPADDIGPDGVRHAEDGRDVPGRACLCGFASPSAAGLDAHLLASFTRADETGSDGRRHSPVTDGG